MLNPAPVSAAPHTEHGVLPVDVSVFVSCVNGGEGEFVHITGESRVLRIATFNGITAFTRIQGVMNVTGVGETTGEIYRVASISRESLFINTVGVQRHSLFRSERFIGRGQGDNFLLHFVFHMIFIPNGGMEITVGNFFTECR
jgi:hypothetical protein